jgi:BlaI family penicillinase repressor
MKQQPPPPPISEAEWKVMRVLWRKSPLPAYDIIQELSGKEHWHANTIKTLLTRLQKKNAVAIEKYKNLFLYSAAVSEEECIQAESESFLDRIFGGAVQPLLVHFANRRKLTKADLEALRKILEGKDKK